MTGSNSFWLANPSSGFYNGVATQSARFDSNHYMTETPSSAGNRKQFTFSWWMKKHYATGYSVLYSTAVSGSNSNSTLFHLYADNSNGRISAGGVDFAGYTLGYQRDLTNWYHCVVVVDTDQSSNNDRVKIYINGIQNSAMSGTCPQSNLAVNSTQTYHIGRRRINSDRYANLYLADFHLVDGTAISDTSRTNPATGATEYVIDEFGEFNNGVWIPKAYSGSYGTNGFRMEFSGTGTSADSSGIGADTSGNNHHHAVTNFTANDSNMPDSPENNFCTLNPLNTNDNRGQVTISRGNLRMVSGSSDRGFTTGTMKLTGKVYFEVLCRDHNSGFVGINNIDNTVHSGKGQSLDFYLGTPRIDNTILSNTGTFDDGDIMGVAVDVDAKSIQFFNNNSSILDTTYSTDAEYFPYLYDSSGGRQMDAVANFGQDSSFTGEKTSGSNNAQDSNGQGDFYYTPPSGFLALCNANMPDTGFNADETNQPTAFHNVVLYTGNGYPTSNGQSITGVGFQPDWVWIKDRDNSNINHSMYDSTRGVTKELSPNATTQELAEPTFLTAFNSDGFSLGAGNEVNYQNVKFVAWNWKVNGGTTTTDTTGTQDSILQTNQTLGMTIGTHEATSGTYTFAHGLGATPEFFMFRNIDGADNWVYWHTGMAAAGTTLQYINSSVSNSNSGSNWLSTFNSTLIGITTGQVSGTSGTHLFWAFRSIEGFSKFGSYEGNANADGSLIYTGFRPSLIWIKNYDTGSTDHLIYDDARDKSSNPGNPREYHLITNSTDDTQDLYDIDFLSNGFKIRHGDVNNINAGDTYLYWAWAHNPFKFSNAF